MFISLSFFFLLLPNLSVSQKWRVLIKSSHKKRSEIKTTELVLCGISTVLVRTKFIGMDEYEIQIV